MTEASSPEPRPEPPVHVVLYAPEIPQNTGNIGRLCAYTGARLHLIEPLGFSLSEKYLRRAGMDYWRALDVRVHRDFAAFQRDPDAPRRLWLFTTQAETSYWDGDLQRGDGLVFGNEGHGAPAWLHEAIGADRRLKIDQLAPGLRSLNLATSVGVATYEVLRRLRA